MLSTNKNSNISVARVTIRNGRPVTANGRGGGIYNTNTAALTLTDSAVTGNAVVGTPTNVNGVEQVNGGRGGIWSQGALYPGRYHRQQ